jgi:RNA polymerase sigma-70 factor (ECF subfamily)
MTQDLIQISDTELVARLKRRDKRALEDLVRIHGAKLYGVALQFVRNETDAQDVVQDALVSIWKRIDSFEGRSAFTSWLYRVTANAALMALRKRRKRDHDVPEENLSNLPDRTPLPVTALINGELGQRVRAGIDTLPDSYREVVLLRDVDELSLEEIAEVTGLSESAIKSRLHRGRLLLRQALLPYLKGQE